MDQLGLLNTEQYSTYENSLAIIQKRLEEQKMSQSETQEPIKETKETIVEPKKPTQPAEQSNSWVLFLGIGMLIASSIALYYKKYYKL